MGYTNYWNQPTDFTDEEWDAVVREFKYVCDMGEDFIDEVTISNIKDGGVTDAISFNALNCETFYICKAVSGPLYFNYSAEDNTSFWTNFCKTNARTIDIYVWHMLTFCQMIKEDFTCSRDWWYWEKKNKKEKA